MINSNGLGKSGSGMPAYHKQPPVTIKKIALRDVQNNNLSLIHDHPESSPLLEGRPIADATKISGTKRLTPEYTSIPPFLPSLSNNGASEHLVCARRKFESEVGKGRIQDTSDKNADFLPSSSMNFCHKQQEIPQQQTEMRKRNMHCFPVVTPNHMASTMTFSYGAPSFSISHGKPGNRLPLPGPESKCLKLTSEVHHSIDSKANDDQQRKERFLRLQRFLKHCDESYQRDYIQVLLHITPTELSRHAIELEKRAIQLTVEEGKEMQRMKALNIFGKSGRTNNPLPTTQHRQSEK
ncbi:uncharacterized protein LOC132278901 [Cornus florida]|uniref:uncharacterized protein LOC132278901 n=1 Tax=Cornus florida TaxID=4283 RepID=UPI00289F8629|nr:uncharacterized protein LOC132278901 [Cornus florida]XP_059636786.1 uncharacterized protein LOC132278901 [Cornus florida]XP_059636787.1 uncharacterized protein LOC132278901 [Cornus florida]XP_059636788.1 uncharacterized protein LOC132278901 [Cornus florida]XP_059636789.1 uncharacterized protein LOC132278901 [Cornus florida]